ncbi:extracellular solute-binding protein [Paenibacillus sp. LHD-117]|uniref:extracellular solute-binding protein n=1 Tax=Paenibacillus sp. LHD-117 TaxID=3071412 RepID=UPI0027E003B1|nr:extracellular solute-binding protein [Paenibacillus sp. LHD-117]MDQ6420162.1 extracellular solute-binding protein [Paenibacillus sp. LHD-117]
MQRNGKKMKKRHLLLMMAMIMAMLATACSNGANGSNTPENDGKPQESDQPSGGKQGEEDPYEGLPKKVSISMFDRGRVSSDEGTYEDNRWVKWIREQSGIDVSIVPVPRNQSQDSLNVLFASNQAPDLVWEYDRSYVGKLVSQGVIQPIGDYIEKYSTSYKKYLEENPDLLPHLTFNGEIYAIATKRPITGIANHGIWIRQDWLDELNLEQPQTVEQFIEVAKAFKEHDPDSSPIVGHTTSDIYAAMYGAINSMWYLEDGKMKYGATLDRFAEVIELEKQLYELGLVDREYLTDNDNQRSKQLWTTGKAGIYLGQWGGGTNDIMIQDLLANVPEARPVPMEMVESPYGRYGAFQESTPNIFVTFNKEIKNPKAAIEYLDWLVDGGWFPLAYGEEGVHYNMVNGVPKRIDEDKFNKEVLYAGEYAVLRQQVVNPEDLLAMASDDEKSQKIAGLNVESIKLTLKHEFRRDMPYQPSFDEINEIRSTLDTFIKETRATAVTQGEKYDGAWALGEIRKEWERLGGAKAEEIAQKWYEENKGGF